MSADIPISSSGKTVIQPPTNAIRWTLSAWIILSIGVTLIVSSSVQMAYRLALPTDGWSWTSGAVGSELEDTITYRQNLLRQPSPLQPGDFVLAVEGYPYAELMRHATTFQPPLIRQWQAGHSVRYLVRRGDAEVTLDVPLYIWGVGDLVRLLFSNHATFVTLLSAAIGLVVFRKRPYDFAARLLFLLTAIVLTGHISEFVYWGLPEIVHPPLLIVALLFSNWIFGGLLAPTVLLLALTFPQPKPFVERYPLLVSILVYMVLPLLVIGAGPQPFLGWGWTASCGLLSLISVGHTLFTAKDPVSRAQLRWAGLGFAGLALSLLLEATHGFELYPPVIQQLLPWLTPLLQMAFPLALAVAILRYRLFDLDLLINRALVYLTLTAGVVGVYVLVVSGLGAWLRMPDSLFLSLLATSLVAVLFAPVREWVQRGVNRLLYGERDEPYRLLTRLGRQLAITQEPTTALAQTVETVAKALKLPYVAITRQQAESQQRIATYGQAQATVNRYPLVYAGEPIGELEVAPRQAHELLTPADERLLRDLARQLGVAVHAAQLTTDLRQSRTRLVTAREEERRRLRRDLHDGLGPQLASQTLTLDVIAKLLHSNPEQAATLLLAVRQQMQQAVSDIRDLIYGLRPPVLDDLGLQGAIEEFVERIGHPGKPQINVQVADVHVALPAAVEVAVYRIVQEAVTNVIKHAQASQITVALMVERASQGPCSLRVTICDDGSGVPADYTVGIGLQSMRERAEELGGSCVIGKRSAGGTEVTAQLPIQYVAYQE
jgi:signal transduction histidine kinase